MKRLIVAPHCDDEVLWNFAVLPGSTVVILSDQCVDQTNFNDAIHQRLIYLFFLEFARYIDRRRNSFRIKRLKG